MIVSILQKPYDAKPELSIHFAKDIPNAKVQSQFSLSKADFKSRDLEWKNALENNPIEVNTFNGVGIQADGL